MAFKIEGKEM